MTVRINNAFIRKISSEKPAAVREFRDASLRGFIARQQTTGFISYYATSSTGSARKGNRRQKRWRLGEHPALSPSQARAAAEEIISQARLSKLPLEKEAERWTLGSFLDSHYFPWMELHLKDPAGQRGQLRQFTHWHSYTLDEIDRHLVETWRGKRIAEGKSPNTINRNACAIRSVLSKAVEWGYLRHHPLEGLKPLRLDRGRRPRTLTTEERERLMEGLAARDRDLRQKRENANEWRRVRGYPVFPQLPHFGDYLTPLVLTAYHTGMRRGEVFALQWSDVDFKQRLITVRGHNSKTAQTRQIPINDALIETLTKWREHNIQQVGFVFPGRNGQRLDNIQTSWERLRRRYNLGDIKFKDLRSNFGSRLANGGIDLSITQQLLGHSSPVVTMRYYVSIQEETMRTAVNTISN